MARQKRNSWMRSSVVRRAATVVDEEVAALCEKSPFLNSLTANNTNENEIALFHRLEVHLGKALGRGGFAEVYSVAGLDAEDDDDDERALNRKACRERLLTSSGRPAYAIKFLRKKLLSNTREFQHAAIDLAVESKYLAALSHRNIIKIRGLTAGGTGAFRTGKHDDFFIIMDHLQETLEHRMQRWKQREKSLPTQYFARTLDYAHQIADALAYLHDKEIVYRDLKPQNLGFRERNTIQLFDFGLCRELPKPKGQCHGENLEDEETFHMSGVGTQRYMAPEILNTRQYNLKADVFSWAMVALEMMTWEKPFSEYSPKEHEKFVAGMGERPKLINNNTDRNKAKAKPMLKSILTFFDRNEADEAAKDNLSGKDWTHASADSKQQQQSESSEVLKSLLTFFDRTDDDKAAAPAAKDSPCDQGDTTASEQQQSESKQDKKQAQVVDVQNWPSGMADLLEESWSQDVVGRLTIKSVLERMGAILAESQSLLDDSSAKQLDKSRQNQEEAEVVLEFPSHFSPRHPLLETQRDHSKPKLQPVQTTRDDSVSWFGDRQSLDASNSLQELTMTSTSTTIYDSNYSR